MSELSKYEDFPVPTRFRSELLSRLLQDTLVRHIEEGETRDNDYILEKIGELSMRGGVVRLGEVEVEVELDDL